MLSYFRSWIFLIYFIILTLLWYITFYFIWFNIFLILLNIFCVKTMFFRQKLCCFIIYECIPHDVAWEYTRGISIQRYCLTSIGIPIIKIRRPHDRLIFMMEIPYLERPSLYWNRTLYIPCNRHTCLFCFELLWLYHQFVMVPCDPLRRVTCGLFY